MNMLKTSEYRSGQIMLSAIILVFFVFLGASALLTSSFERSVSEQRLSRLEDTREIAEAGVERAIYELNVSSSYTGATENIGQGSTVISVASNSDGTKTITSTAQVQDQQVISSVIASAGPVPTGASFYYALQVGSGGITFKNNARVVGNVVADGSIVGANGASISQTASVSGSGHSISTLSIGTDALVDTVTDCVVGQDAKTRTINKSTIGRDAYAATITSSTIGRDAYANTITKSTVAGHTYAGSGVAPPAAVAFALTDAQIDTWQNDAAAGGTISSYISGNNQSISLGPVKINGDLTINNGTTLTVTGTIWVTGTITFNNGTYLQLDSGYGANSGILIASDPSNPTTNGKIVMQNNVTVTGSGQSTSNVLLISRLQGVASTAIDAANNSSSMTLYAPQGSILIHNNFIVNSVTAYQLKLENNAQVVYNSGLASSEFAAGPGGAWQVLSGSVEIR